MLWVWNLITLFFQPAFTGLKTELVWDKDGVTNFSTSGLCLRSGRLVATTQGTGYAWLLISPMCGLFKCLNIHRGQYLFLPQALLSQYLASEGLKSQVPSPCGSSSVLT